MPHIVVGTLSLLVALVVGGSAAADDDRAAGEAAADARQVASPPPSRLIFWVGCEKDVVPLTNAQLDTWRSRGVDGFVCMADRIMDTKQTFSGNPKADLSADSYRLQRALRDSKVVERAAARGMKMYLGVKLVNTKNRATPLLDWFDDPGWSERVLPKFGDLAGAAKLLGFAGVAFDQEMYPTGNRKPTWNWSYLGNSHTEAQVREKARQRGAEVMEAILAGYPGAEFAVYHAFFPGDWRELIQQLVNRLKDTSTKRLDVDFWNGMTSVEGYGAIRFFDSIFYKTPHKGTWDNALTYNQNRVYATFSRRFSNWEHASSRVHVSPFAWIDDGPKPKPSFDDPRSPAYVAEQLLAFRKWSMGGEFANFAYAPLDVFNYSPYVSAMQDASTPAEVDGQDPTLEVTGVAGEGPAALIEGTAHDNLAIRAVRWADNRGGAGVAALDWQVLSGNHNSGYQWQTRWSIPAAALTPGATNVTIRAEDIKENASTGIVVGAP